MKLYEAILAGCRLTEQGRGNDGMWGERRCVLGAALSVLAPTIQNEVDGYTFLRREYPFLEQKIGNWWLMIELAVRNDRGESREDLAYWLRDNFEGVKNDTRIEERSYSLVG